MAMFSKIQQRLELGGIFEVNVTPLVDVSLVLVCILLLSSPLAFESSIAVKKSAISAAVVEEKIDLQRVELRVVSEDSVLVNESAVARRDLRRSLAPLLEASPNRLVVVGCEDAVSHGAFVDVLDHAKIAGATEIAVVGR
jgi:biopolymer transport protein ExbD